MATIDVTTDDRHTQTRLGGGHGIGGIGVFDDRVTQQGACVRAGRLFSTRTVGRRHRVVLGVEAMRALAHVPSVVATALDDADLLPQPLTGIADEESVSLLHVE